MRASRLVVGKDFIINREQILFAFNISRGGSLFALILMRNCNICDCGRVAFISNRGCHPSA